MIRRQMMRKGYVEKSGLFVDEGQTSPSRQRRETARDAGSDPIDYDQRHFANLAATAFLLALALCIGATMKWFDYQQNLEKCLLSGRKNCVEVSQGAPRGMVILKRDVGR